jgi:transcription elongation factor Elf1
MKVKVMDEPMECIHCTSENIQAETIDGSTLSRQVVCLECEGSWFECFKFVGVIVDDDN